MVERIVVLGIIGVITAIVLPMISGAGKPQEANAKAKSFYYTAQNVFMDYKIDAPELESGYFSISANGSNYTASAEHQYYFVMARAEQNVGFTKITVAVSNSASAQTEEEYMCLKSSYTIKQEFDSGELIDKFNGYSANDDYGYYFALVDYKCRVVATYWSEEPLSVLSDNTLGEFKKNTVVFTENNKVDHTFVGAFPTEKGAIGSAMFEK